MLTDLVVGGIIVGQGLSLSKAESYAALCSVRIQGDGSGMEVGMSVLNDPLILLLPVG